MVSIFGIISFVGRERVEYGDEAIKKTIVITKAVFAQMPPRGGKQSRCKSNPKLPLKCLEDTRL